MWVIRSNKFCVLRGGKVKMKLSYQNTFINCFAIQCKGEIVKLMPSQMNCLMVRQYFIRVKQLPKMSAIGFH